MEQEKKVGTPKQRQGRITTRAGFNRAELGFKIERRNKGYRFDTFLENKDNSNNLKRCLEYVEGWPQTGGIVMAGGCGTGKTHLGVAICQELVKLNVSCLVTSVNKIIRDVRATWGKDKDASEDDVIAKYVDPDVLLLDEIGTQNGTDSERVILNEIINDRYEGMKPIIAIGNQTGEEMKATLGERVVDRLIHDGIILKFNFDSMRKIK